MSIITNPPGLLATPGASGLEEFLPLPKMPRHRHDHVTDCPAQRGPLLHNPDLSLCTCPELTSDDAQAYRDLKAALANVRRLQAELAQAHERAQMYLKRIADMSDQASGMG